MKPRRLFLFFVTAISSLFVSGCASSPVEVAGLQLFDPPALRGAAKVDSLKPTLRWQKFDSVTVFDTDTKERIGVITYDLKIWIGYDGRPGALMYERRKLTSAFHRLSESLSPSTEYFWSVRARFQLDGNPRATEWSVRVGFPFLNSRRWQIVPNPAFPSFETTPNST